MGFAIYRSVKFASSAPVALIGGILRFGICSMIVINDKTFYDFPIMCGGCPFYLGNGKLEGGKESISGFCALFDKKKGYYSNIPSRCKKLFDKARTYPNGAKLVIVQK